MNRSSEAESSPVLGFIVGMSRSGTKWMSRCLNRHSAVAVFGESGFWGRYAVQPEGPGYTEREYGELLELLSNTGINATAVAQDAGGARAVLREIVEEAIADGESLGRRELFDRWGRAIAGAEGAEYVLEKTPHHVNWLDEIVEAYPEAKFVVMRRRPYEFMLSYKYQGLQDGEERRSQFRRRYHPLGCALVYRGYLRSIRRAVERHADRCIVVEKSELEEGDDEVLRRVQRFLGLELEEGLSMPAQNSSFQGRERRSLESEDEFWMNLVAGREIRRSGFTLREIDVDPKAVAESLAALPVWGLRTARHLAETTGRNPVAYVWNWLTR